MIRYTEGRAQIKIKKRTDNDQSQNAITLGFGTQSPSPKKNEFGLGFKDLDDEIEEESGHDEAQNGHET